MKRYKVAVEYYFQAEDHEDAFEQFLDAVATLNPSVAEAVGEETQMVNTQVYDKVRERMMNDPSVGWEPCDYGCSFIEVNDHSFDTPRRLFTVVPCRTCTESTVDDFRQDWQDHEAERQFEEYVINQLLPHN